MQRGHHSRMIGSRVVTDADDKVTFVEINQLHSSLANSDRLGKPDRRRLVTHVRAIGKIVRAKGANKQLVEERGFV